MKRFILTTVVASSMCIGGFSTLYASSGEELAKANGCMECHNIMGKKLAPAFMGTARKNIKWFGIDAKIHIVESIKKGSKGKYRNFTNIQMPEYGHISNDDLDVIASWILSEYEKNRKLNLNQRRNSQNQGQGRGRQ